MTAGRRRYTDKTHSKLHSFVWSLLGQRRMLGTLRLVSLRPPYVLPRACELNSIKIKVAAGC